MSDKAKFEYIESKAVLNAGGKVLDLAERELWSNGLLYCVLVELTRFLEGHGVSRVSADEIINNN